MPSLKPNYSFERPHLVSTKDYIWSSKKDKSSRNRRAEQLHVKQLICSNGNSLFNLLMTILKSQKWSNNCCFCWLRGRRRTNELEVAGTWPSTLDQIKWLWYCRERTEAEKPVAVEHCYWVKSQSTNFSSSLVSEGAQCCELGSSFRHSKRKKSSCFKSELAFNRLPWTLQLQL